MIASRLLPEVVCVCMHGKVLRQRQHAAGVLNRLKGPGHTAVLNCSRSFALLTYPAWPPDWTWLLS
eukprot:1158008-Pelagomonas_calceolata.AAC.3